MSEDFFSINDPAPSSRQNLKIYPGYRNWLVLARIGPPSGRDSRALHRVVPLKCKMFYVGDEPDNCSAHFRNPDFSRISKTKNILKTRTSSVTLADLEKLYRGSRQGCGVGVVGSRRFLDGVGVGILRVLGVGVGVGVRIF